MQRFRLVDQNAQALLAECLGCNRVLRVDRNLSSALGSDFVVSPVLVCLCGQQDTTIYAAPSLVAAKIIVGVILAAVIGGVFGIGSCVVYVLNTPTPSATAPDRGAPSHRGATPIEGEANRHSHGGHDHYIDALTLANRTPSDIAEELRQNKQWNHVELLLENTRLFAHNADNEYLLMQWDRRKLLYMSLSVPEAKASPAEALRLVGVTSAPSPTRTWSNFRGLNLYWEWNSGFGPFGWAQVFGRAAGAQLQPNWVGTSVRLYYVPKSVVEKWQSEG